MTGHEIAEKLRQLNRWRRGDDETLLMPDPAAIGRWIDAAADALEEQDKRAAELARVMTERDKYHGALVARHGGEPVAILAELDTERARVAELEAQIERNAWAISPAMAQARIEQLAARVAELEAALRAILGPYADDGDALAKIAHAEDVLARAESADLVQEACGGRCGDPYCDLSTEGELMRTPADPFPCRSDPLRKGTDYKIRAAIDAARNQGGAS